MESYEFTEEDEIPEVGGVTDIEEFEKFKKSVINDVEEAFKQIKAKHGGEEMSWDEVAFQRTIFLQGIEEPLMKNIQPFFKDLIDIQDGKIKAIPNSKMPPKKKDKVEEEKVNEQVNPQAEEDKEKVNKQTLLLKQILQRRCQKLYDLEVTLNLMLQKKNVKLPGMVPIQIQKLVKEVEKLSSEQDWDLPIMQYISNVCKGILPGTEDIYKKIE